MFHRSANKCPAYNLIFNDYLKAQMISVPLCLMLLLTTFQGLLGNISRVVPLRTPCVSALHFPMPAPHNESDPHTRKRPKTRSDLQPSTDLDISASTLSFFCPLRPRLSKDALAEALRTLDMRSHTMPSSSHNRPPEDLHGERQDEQPPLRSKKATISAIVGTFRASKTLQQPLGSRVSKPFAPPPVIPNNLTARFEAALHVHTKQTTGVVASRRTENFHQGKTNLADILEERESPVRAQLVKPSPVDTRGESKIQNPEWPPDKRAIAVPWRYTFLDSDSDAANDIAEGHTDSELDDEDCDNWKYGSRTTVATSDCSRPGSAMSSEEVVAATLCDLRASATLPPTNYDENYDAGVSTRCPTSESVPPGLCSSPARPSSTAGEQTAYRKLSSRIQNSFPSLRQTESLPVLVPSPGGLLSLPRVSQQPHNIRNSTQRHIGSTYDRQNGLEESEPDDNKQELSSPMPQITIQAPSPARAPTSRKRAPSPSIRDKSGHPLSQRVHRDLTAGLPVLPAREEAVWKAAIPGNTPALLTTLLTWSYTMWTFYNQLPNPKLFSIHLAFPYAVSPPKRQLLLSVSFYDTSVEPNREVRFLGPGDAAEISYNEVDVFNNPDIIQTKSHSPSRAPSAVDAIKQSLGLRPTTTPNHTRHPPMSHLARTGEGKWCYILIKAHSPPAEEDEAVRTPPHVLLAWHCTAVTAVSDCLHTVFPDNTPSPFSSTAPAQQHTGNLRRFSSLQSLNSIPCRSSRSGFQQSLRAASSSSDLPVVGAGGEMDILQEVTAATLHRCVVKMGRAGGVPLVEGWRVDIRAFAGWMEACGRGEGKVIMWREREGIGTDSG